MKTIQEIQNANHAKHSQLYDRMGVFFAFGTEQFERQRKEGVEYVAGPCNMVIPKDNAKEFVAEFKKLSKELTKEYRTHIPMDRMIAYQLSNYEAYYSGEIDEAYEMTVCYYPECTMEDVRRVYLKKLEEIDDF